MKPIRLEIEGIHSFTEKQTVDFERLCQNKLFGIFGSTGSGKSTVLDCIMLSLYGSINRYGDKNVTDFINDKSDFASVEFEFILHEEGRDNRYVLKRTFKKRKSGTATTAVLTQILDNGDILSLAEKTERIKSFVEEHLGLSSDQFKKCIALPQGEFSALLKASKTEQTDLIGRLFDLEQYGYPLFERFSSRYSGLDAETNGLLSQLSQLGDLSKKRGKELTENLNELLKKVIESEKKGEELTKKLAELSEGLKNIQKVEGIRQILSDLTAKLPKVEDLKTKLKQTEKANELLPVFNRKAKAENEVLQAKNQTENAKTALEKAEKCKTTMAERFEIEGASLLTEIQEGTNKISALSALSNSVQEIEELDGQLMYARTEFSKLKTSLTDKEKEEKELCKERESTQKNLFEAVKNAAELEELFERLTKQEFHRGKTQAYGEISEKLQSDKALSDGKTACYIESLAEFIQRLQTALPTLEQAEGDIVRIREERKKAEEVKTSLQNKGKAEEIKAEKIQSEMTAISEKISRLTEDGKEKSGRRSAAFEKLQKYGLTDIKQYSGYLNQLRSQHAKCESQKSVLESQKQTAEIDFSRCNALCEGAEKALLEKQSAFKEIEQEAISLLLSHGYTSFDEVKPFLLNKEQTEGIRKDVQNFETDIKATTEQLKRESLSLPKTAVTEEQILEAEEEREKNNAQIKDFTAERARLLFEKKQYDGNLLIGGELEKRLTETSGELKLCDVLKNLTKGKALMEYAAEEYFAEISYSASQKLSQLTNGRYALQYRGGFLVSDNLSGGAEREVKTLSGGETFLVSLSLAVALQETIVSLSGKPLDFFFLDEGFGTLDETLAETVMDSLEKLKDTHFTIGLISHLPELRRRIPAKLLITPATENSGSVVTLVV